MKRSQTIIEIDQRWLHYKRECEAKRERIITLYYALAMLVIGSGTLWLTLTIIARTPV